MYAFLLTLHSLSRWLVLLFGIWAIYRAVTGLTGKRSFEKADRSAGMLFGGMIDLQLLLGLILYVFFSPFPKAMLNDFGAAMSDTITRYFAMEHILIMLIVVVLVHIGSAKVKKAPSDGHKHRRALVWYGVCFVLILAMIPWPFMEYGRPLLRLFGLTL